MQVLEAIVNKLVLDQVKEQEEWKSTTKETNYKNAVEIGNMKKNIIDQNKSNEKLQKINCNLQDHIQILEVENEGLKNWYTQVQNQIKKINREQVNKEKEWLDKEKNM